MTLREVQFTIEIPRGTGRGGFLHAIGEVLRFARVTNLNIDSRGVMRVTRHVLPNEPEIPVQIDFSSVTPAVAIASSEVVEVAPVRRDESAPVAMDRLFSEIAADHSSPVAFVVGAQTLFRDWHRSSGSLIRSQAYGVPVLDAGELPEDILVLCTAYSAGGVLADVQRSYRMLLPPRALWS